MKLSFSKDLPSLFNFTAGGIYSTVIAKSPTYSYTLLCLSKGTGLDEHTSTKTGLVYVLKGSGVFKLEGKDITLREGIAVFMPKDAAHSVTASEDLALLLCLAV